MWGDDPVPTLSASEWLEQHEARVTQAAARVNALCPHPGGRPRTPVVLTKGDVRRVFPDTLAAADAIGCKASSVQQMCGRHGTILGWQARWAAPTGRERRRTIPAKCA